MLADEIKSLMDYSMEEHEVPFSDIAISKNNKIVCRYKNGPIDGNELYFLYSASKPITCTAALQLYEKGLISLDDCVYRYIPEFRNMEVRTSDGITETKTPITLKHLFTMTSGVNYNLKSKSITNVTSKNKNATTLDIVKAIANEPLDFEPGTHWEYGLSHDILAGVIEVVTGMSFGEYLRKNVFDICGIENTHLHCDSSMKICNQFRYDENKMRVVPIKKENEFIFTPNYESGGAGIISSVYDYMKFAQALVNTEKLLKKETLKMMSTPQLINTSYHDFKTFFTTFRNEYSYGLGVRVNEGGQFSVKGEFGWDGAAGAYALFDITNNIAVFYATHIRDYGSYLYNDLHLKLRNAVYKYL